MRHHMKLLAIAGVCVATLVGCGGSGEGAPSSSASAPPSGSTSATASMSPTATESPASPSTSLVGQWQASAQEVLGANTANVGGPGGLSCTGQIRMTFTDSGTFSRSGAVRCTVGSTTRRGGVASAGRYSTNGDQLVIEGTRSTGTTPDSWGDATATYAVTGDTLTIQFTQGSVGTITQTYQRVG